MSCNSAQFVIGVAALAPPAATSSSTIAASASIVTSDEIFLAINLSVDTRIMPIRAFPNPFIFHASMIHTARLIHLAQMLSDVRCV